ncbi:universal stress protein [Billgrantia sp. LNSP4103-1]|uniref:universal stress protein n=1 Tax=Billgrantia sp. LNSP4103-1 TaxID=3410266 RepID=UPI00403F6CDC
MSGAISLVIVPVDGSPAANAATRHAALLAHLLEARLQLVHVMPLNPAELSDVPANRQAEMDRDRSLRLAAAKDALSSARAAIPPTLAPAPQEITLEEEGFVRHPARAILDHARKQERCLLVVGARHSSDFGKLVEGSVSNELVHKATCPVTVVHPEMADETGERIGKVLLPVDGSPHCDRAAGLAGELARSAGATVELLYCRPAGALPFQEGESDESEHVFDQARQHLGEIPAGVATHCLEGERYAEVIINFAHGLSDSPVIVMGRRGLGTWREKLLGSVSHRVIDLAHCPVTVTV